MGAATLWYLLGGCAAIVVYFALLVALVRWSADGPSGQVRQLAPRPYRVTLLDRLRRRHWVLLAHKKYAMYSADRAAVRFLTCLSRWRLVQLHDSVRSSPLMAFRCDFRRLRRDRPIAGLLWCLLHGNAEMQRIAAWLLGQCGSQAVAPALVQLARHPQPSLRREMARGLRRLNAWAELRTIGEHETDPTVLVFSQQRPPKSFESRLAEFLGQPQGSS
jgi:hypothetical protein